MSRLAQLVGSLGLIGLVVGAAHADPSPIIGGTTSTVGQFPSVVALEVGGGLCTGTLITKDWVLTAAHCVDPEVVQLPSQQAVTDSLKIHFDTVSVFSGGTTVKASASFKNPAFSVNNLGSADVGLIKLATPITTIKPSPVNLLTSNAPVGVKVTMVGFGTIQRGAGGGAGIEYFLENRTSTECGPFGLSDADLLCFSQVDNKGKCQGDSGGPSFARIGGVLTVVGITSFGDQQCAEFGADTRTDIEKAFILSHVPELVCDDDTDCPDQVCFDHKCIVTPLTDSGLGSTCATNVDCESSTCADGPGGKKCTMGCTVGAALACPDGLECLGDMGASGACWPIGAGEDTGCCDTGGRGAPTALFAIGFVALALRRRRR